MSTTIKLKIHFTPGNRNHRELRKGKQPTHSKSVRLPRVTRLMALAVKYEELLAKGLVRNHVELAELAHVERSHISTLLRLRLLAPDIQEWLLSLPENERGKNPVSFVELRKIAETASWEEQRRELHSLIPEHFPSPPIH